RIMESHDLPTPMSIRFLTGPLDGQTFLIEKPVVTIGRDLANDIAISTDLQVSRQHARLIWTGVAWQIENISRANFIQIDGQDAQQAILSTGTVVSLGETSSFTTLPAEVGVDDASKTVGTMATALASDPPPAPDQMSAARITAAPARSDQHLTIDSQRSPVDATEIARLDGA